jgi:F-type H+-transporting ATPase subunit delta
MSDSYYEVLTQQLRDATGKKVALEHSVDSSLVAGAVARIGDAVIDASVNGRLAKLERDVLSALSMDEA